MFGFVFRGKENNLQDSRNARLYESNIIIRSR